ncbi:hypothetical protein [Hymenobacter pini]|uniref:hypothetical protein n=1 Tax=Hymenobacter pini TaxID=2880879 RepID=UPI001CF3355A|nr:hypothetical protein [Hymenobacter pini]MCA8829112.1 hypothetical protein [Hymenobacter pini]
MPVWFITLCKGIDFVVYWAMVIPIAIAQYNRRWLVGGLRTLRFIPLFLLVMYCCAQVAIILWRYTLPINHLNTVGEALLYLKVYHDEFTNSIIKRRVRLVAVIFLAFAVVDSFWLEGFQQINAYTNLIESFLIITLALIYFEIHILRRQRIAALRKPMFVASIGIILYLAGTIVLHLVTNHLIAANDEGDARIVYLISSFLLFLMVTLFSRAFWLARPVKALDTTTAPIIINA